MREHVKEYARTREQQLNELREEEQARKAQELADRARLASREIEMFRERVRETVICGDIMTYCRQDSFLAHTWLLEFNFYLLTGLLTGQPYSNYYQHTQSVCSV